MGSQASLDVDRIQRKNEERLRRLNNISRSMYNSIKIIINHCIKIILYYTFVFLVKLLYLDFRTLSVEFFKKINN